MERIRCAAFHEAAEADPVGSTGAHDAYLFVEVPLPWERDISMHEPFAGLPGNWRAQAVVPRGRGEEGAGEVTVLAFDQEHGVRRGPFRRREWNVPYEELAGLCRSIVEDDAVRLDSMERHRQSVPAQMIDLFICTHGSRDTCCGGPGTVLYEKVTQQLGGRPELRVWRVSHTGGHRFAPTALTFPDGYAWAHLDADLVDRLVLRHGEPGDLVEHCRGSSLFDGPAQVADRELLARVGWSWTGASRSVAVIDFDRSTMSTRYRVEATLIDATNVAAEVQVDLDRHVPQPTCGAIDAPEYRVEPVWRATSFEWTYAEIDLPAG